MYEYIEINPKFTRIMCNFTRTIKNKRVFQCLIKGKRKSKKSGDFIDVDKNIDDISICFIFF
jgi:hypothetical protein